jgi:diguanylate cyclase (GGDEF)-like protein
MGRRAAVVSLPARDRLVHACVATAVLAVIWWVTSILGLTPAVWGSAIIPVALALSGVTNRIAATTPGLTKAGRRFWRHIALTQFVAAAGCSMRSYHILTGADPAIANYHPLDMSVLILAVGIEAWAMIRLPLGLRSRPMRWAFGLDVCTVLVAAGLFWWQFVFRQLVVDGQGGGMIFALIAVASSQVILFALIKVAITGSMTVDRDALRLMGIALVTATILSVPEGFLVTFTDLTITQVSLPLACLIAAVASQRQWRSDSAQQQVDRRRPRRAFSALPYVAVAAMDALLLISTGYASRYERLMIAVGAVVVTMLVVARQFLTFQENRRLQRRLTEQATHDPLTGLANRELFNQRIEQALAADAATTAVVLVDLNEFKGVNDSLGHAVGDLLLIATADRLRALAPTGATAARLGGDEFALLVPDTTAEGTTDLAARIERGFDPPVAVGDGRELPMAASIGHAVGWAGADPDELLRRADVAMYAAKSGGDRGRTRHAGYDANLDRAFTARTQLEEDLRRALDEGEMAVHYQPVVELASGRPVGVEALLRWTHPDFGPVSPVMFVPVAERTGLIVPIGLWVLRTACAQAAAWLRQFGDDAPTVSVNVSARQLRDGTFVDHVAAVLAEHDLPPHRLTIEITESMAIAEPAACSTVTALHELGVRISLDDFGTGYSALSMLDRCPVDEVKLDLSFTRTCVEPDRRRVVTAVREIARALGLHVVAEGVETRAEAEQLAEMGYGLAQGFLYAPALPAPDVTAMVTGYAERAFTGSQR